MAQTKRKRRSKHRGNAAGKVEARGRTNPTTTLAPVFGRIDHIGLAVADLESAIELHTRTYGMPPA